MLTRIIPLIIPFGVRLFHASPVFFDDFNSAPGEAQITGFIVPDNITPAPNATPFSNVETQEFLARYSGNFQKKWMVINMPGILEASFIEHLTNNIAQIPEGQAYAALFIAEGDGGRYASLGPSIIVTSNTDSYSSLSPSSNFP